MMETASYMTSEPSAGRWKYLGRAGPERRHRTLRAPPPLPRAPCPGQLPPSPPEVVEEEGDVEAQRHPLSCTQKHQTEEAVDGIFWNHQLGREGEVSDLVPEWR